MGQYYRPVLVKENGERTIYNRSIGKEYTMAKLMEHSWINNPMVNLICKELYKKPQHVYWCGDYADEKDENWNDVLKDVWEPDGVALRKPKYPFHPYALYLVNHTKKCYIAFDEYILHVLDTQKETREWVIHPLPLLTAVGNGKGGGDFHEEYIGFDDVGIWAGDLLSVEDYDPKFIKEYVNVSKDIAFIEER